MGILGEDTLLNGASVKIIKSDPLSQVRFTNPSRAYREALSSIAPSVKMPTTYNLSTGQLMADTHTEVLRAFSNVIPLRHAHLNERSKRQHSSFTLHGGKYFDGIRFIEVDCIETYPSLENKVVKYKITMEAKARILRELIISGIQESILFPEMQYQAKDIKVQFAKSMAHRECE